MQKNDIESELSYAYLHAVAAKAGMVCCAGSRLVDNIGIDASVTYQGPTSKPTITEVQLNFQLKATVAEPGNYADHQSYYFKGIKQYDWLRKQDGVVDKFLIVLYLPRDVDAWLQCTRDELILKHAAYWVNLYGAPASTNDTGQTVYLPKANLLTPENMLLMVNHSVLKNIPNYQLP